VAQQRTGEPQERSRESTERIRVSPLVYPGQLQGLPWARAIETPAPCRMLSGHGHGHGEATATETYVSSRGLFDRDFKMADIKIGISTETHLEIS